MTADFPSEYAEVSELEKILNLSIDVSKVLQSPVIVTWLMENWQLLKPYELGGDSKGITYLVFFSLDVVKKFYQDLQLWVKPCVCKIKIDFDSKTVRHVRDVLPIFKIEKIYDQLTNQPIYIIYEYCYEDGKLKIRRISGTEYEVLNLLLIPQNQRITYRNYFPYIAIPGHYITKRVGFFIIRGDVIFNPESDYEGVLIRVQKIEKEIDKAVEATKLYLKWFLDGIAPGPLLLVHAWLFAAPICFALKQRGYLNSQGLIVYGIATGGKTSGIEIFKHVYNLEDPFFIIDYWNITSSARQRNIFDRGTFPTVIEEVPFHEFGSKILEQWKQLITNVSTFGSRLSTSGTWKTITLPCSLPCIVTNQDPVQFLIKPELRRRWLVIEFPEPTTEEMRNRFNKEILPKIEMLKYIQPFWIETCIEYVQHFENHNLPFILIAKDVTMRTLQKIAIEARDKELQKQLMDLVKLFDEEAKKQGISLTEILKIDVDALLREFIEHLQKIVIQHYRREEIRELEITSDTVIEKLFNFASSRLYGLFRAKKDPDTLYITADINLPQALCNYGKALDEKFGEKHYIAYKGYRMIKITREELQQLFDELFDIEEKE